MDHKRQFNIDKGNIENSYSNQIEEFFLKIEDLIEKKLEANEDFIKECNEKLNFALYDIDETFSETSFIYNKLRKLIDNKKDVLSKLLFDNIFDTYYNEVPEDINVFEDDPEDFVECENTYDEVLSTSVSEINDFLDKINKILNRKNQIQKKKDEIHIEEIKKLNELEKKIKELQEQFDNLSREIKKN